MFSKKISKNSHEDNHKRASGSKFEWANSIGAPSRNLKSLKRKLADSTIDVASNTYPMPIC